MGARAKSITKKVQLEREAYKDLKARAILAYGLEREKVKGKGACTVANDFVELYRVETGKDVKLCYLTLIRGADGRKSRASSNAARSHVTAGEAKILIDFIG